MKINNNLQLTGIRVNFIKVCLGHIDQETQTENYLLMQFL